MKRVVEAALWVLAGAALVALVVLVNELGGARGPGARSGQPATNSGPAGAPVSSARSPYRWQVVDQNTAHSVMVVEVETGYVAEAPAIAQQLAEPVKDQYLEILVYFFRPAPGGRALSRRVQWTRKGGYQETVYETSPPR